MNRTLTDAEVQSMMQEIKKQCKTNKMDLMEMLPSTNENIGPQNEIGELEMLRTEINSFWKLAEHRKITSHRPLIGNAIILFKRIIRKAIGWYVTPLMEHQELYNSANTRILNILLQRQEELSSQLEIASIKMGKYTELIKQMDDSIESIKTFCGKEIAQLAEDMELLRSHIVGLGNTSYGSYLEFENQFRGTSEDIKHRQEKYVEYFPKGLPIVDIGCGRGEFVELMVKNGHDIVGVDLNEDMVELCRTSGLPVILMDAMEYLESLPNDSLGGVFISQVVEHLSPQNLVRLLSLCYEKLEGGGTIVIETINPSSLYALSKWFYIDPTHVRPVPPELLNYLLTQAGFGRCETVLLSPVFREMLVPTLEIQGENLTHFNEGIRRLNNTVYGNQDYSVIARKVGATS